LSRSGVIGWAKESETKPKVYPILFAHGVLAGVEREVARSVLRKVHDPGVDPGELLLLEIVRQNGTFRRMWLSPAKEYSLVRNTYGTDGKPVMDLRIDHTRDEEVGWVPSRWEYGWIRNGEATQRTVVDVQERSFGLNLPERAFRVTLPIGTRVEDRIARITYVAGAGTASRSAQDKAINNLVESLSGDTASTLGQEHQGRAAGQTPIVSRTNVVVLGVTLVLGGAIVLYLRYRVLTSSRPGTRSVDGRPQRRK